MTQQEILDYNKKCAEFLGWKIVDGIITWIPEENKFQHEVGYSANGFLKFDSDWNWIMEVVEAIEKLDNSKYEVSIVESECAITDKQAAENEENPFMIKPVAACFEANSKKEAVVEAINQFLTWYNFSKNS